MLAGFLLTVAISAAMGWVAARKLRPIEPEWVPGDDDCDECGCECAAEFAVVSGSGAGWGVYPTLAEAETRRGNVAASHPSARIFYRGTCS